MNKKQWRVLGIGLFVIGLTLLYMGTPGCFAEGDLLIACYIRKYAYAIPGLILVVFGTLFNILAELESKH